MPSDAWWKSKAEAMKAAWMRVYGQPMPNDNCLRYTLAQTFFETVCGDAWVGTSNFGATNYRSCTPGELASIASGKLKDGYWLDIHGNYSNVRPATGVKAQLHADSHPGGTVFRVWFAAFSNDTDGAAYYLAIILRSANTRAVLANPASSPVDFATALYQAGYFEGTTPGARPLGKRTLPLTAPEKANVDKYAIGLMRVLPMIDKALGTKAFVPPTPPPAPIPEAPKLESQVAPATPLPVEASSEIGVPVVESLEPPRPGVLQSLLVELWRVLRRLLGL